MNLILTQILILTSFLASPPQEEESAEELVQVSVQADTVEIAPGQTFHLAVQFEIAPEWHIYWKSAGDSGLPIDLQVTAPAGYKVSEILWPRPKMFQSGEFVDYGYEEKATLFVPVTAPEKLPKGKATFQARIGIFVCSDICLDGEVEKKITIRTTETHARDPHQPPEALAREFKALPKRTTDIRLENNTLHVSGPAGTYKSGAFFPIETPGVRIGKAIVKIEGGRFALTAPVKLFPKNALGKPMRVSGLIVLGENRFDPSYEFSLAVPGKKD